MKKNLKYNLLDYLSDINDYKKKKIQKECNLVYPSPPHFTPCGALRSLIPPAIRGLWTTPNSGFSIMLHTIVAFEFVANKYKYFYAPFVLISFLPYFL